MTLLTFEEPDCIQKFPFFFLYIELFPQVDNNCPTYLYRFSMSCSVSGRSLFLVSGRKLHAIPAATARAPYTKNGRGAHARLCKQEVSLFNKITGYFHLSYYGQRWNNTNVDLHARGRGFKSRLGQAAL